jgi:aryl-alcohol dehydrogenase-like predicted oxidoreductase
MDNYPSARRRFMLAVTASLALSSRNNHAGTAMPLRRPIPKTGEKITAVGLGTYQAFDIGRDAAERAAAKDVLRLFVEREGQVIDSSPMYGNAETAVGDLAAELGVRDKLFVATKVWTSGKQAGLVQMQESLRKLQVDRLDLMQVHNLLDAPNHLATLRDWKKAGKIRYLGVTHYHEGAYDALERVIKPGDIDFVQFNYSMAERDAEDRLLQVAADSATAVIINRPFAQASLFNRVKGKPLPDWASEFDCASWAQYFLKYILAQPAVTCVIPATRKPQHLIDNMGAGLGRLPEAALRKRMVEYLEG